MADLRSKFVTANCPSSFRMNSEVLLLFSLVLGFSLFAGAAQQKQKTVGTPVSIVVEAQGPQGLWAQSVQDLSTAELQRLEQLIKGQVSRLSEVRLVAPSDPATHLHFAVVAGRLPGPGGAPWYVVSSVITIAEKEDLLATHDLIAGADLASLSRSIAGQLVSLKLRWALGMLPAERPRR